MCDEQHALGVVKNLCKSLRRDHQIFDDMTTTTVVTAAAAAATAAV
jgi:hypothetical protein